MLKLRSLIVFLLIFVSTLIISGCGAVHMTGDLIRTFSKDVEVAVSPNVTVDELKKNEDIAVSVNPSSKSNKDIVAVFGSGNINKNVISDMITMEFMQLGYSAKTLAENVSDTTANETFAELANKGFDIVLVGNMNIGTTTSTTSHLTGGNIADTGVTSFTIKGIDTDTGSVLFIISTEYGKSKKPKTVAEDLAEIYSKLLKGEIEST
ncbi:hypothetical protein Flexsi_2292 [Flexistipes sinusarabici DSM 4947]|uniref:Penicillin-binding protein activator LpoB n=1 Tax=Flexistipes sinusarabici (strain ATCC 49648 / DSM 4947 / MAS 10) TaxID=717231 RepID=F8E6E0_FLESM|nr:hypothetical protein [Flexistipes sinusarabici]AEI15907.1 hypothetical protein Flexsi_2292 [Flexistipes sinusarabici DSM 4947]